VQPSLDDLLQQLVAAGISRVVMSHGGGTSELSRLSEIGQRYPSIEVSRDAGVSALILGEALLSGAIDFEEAQAIANQAG
jgi:phosphoribosylformimino-5-aminoimidazole carboxamide ribonucleotide (ProFAR) isomerase